jgi:hypothetical protein
MLFALSGCACPSLVAMVMLVLESTITFATDPDSSVSLTQIAAFLRLRADVQPTSAPYNRTMDMAVAGHFRRLSQSPSALGAALSSGVEAIQSATLLFQQRPPEIAGGISKLGLALLDNIDAILTPAGKASWLGYDDFTRFWKKTFQDLPTTSNNITASLQIFSSTGKPGHLVEAVSGILDRAVGVVSNSAPQLLGREITTYLRSLKDTVGSLGEAIVDFENGDTVGGIEDLYFGLRRATEPLLPAELKNDDTYNTIIGTADSVIGGLSKNVLDYRQRILQSEVCWKVSVWRDRSRPAVCSEGYFWDGESHCLPVTESCWQPAQSCVTGFFVYRGHAYENCTSTSHKQPWCSHEKEYKGEWSNCVPVTCEPWMTAVSKPLESSIWGKKPEGTLPAHCNPDGHPDKIDDWCFATCKHGYHSSGHKCWTSCEGKFPADDDVMCGRDPSVIAIAKAEMIATVARSAITVGLAITQMVTSGINADTLSSTIQAFVDLGKPFARPQCKPEPK